MSRAFLDTNVFVYALGRAHPYRAPCRAIIDHLRSGRLVGETSVQVIAEFTYVRGRRGNGYAEAADRATEIAGMVSSVHPVREPDLRRALQTLRAHPTAEPSDALHAAVAFNRGIETILTADRGFDLIDGLVRIDPLDHAAVESLTTPTDPEAG